MNIAQSIPLVTGANRGIGHALVRALLSRGVSRVHATSRNGNLPSDIASDPRVVAHALDITSPEQVAAVAHVADDVTLLINNAGTLSGGSLIDGHNTVELARRDLETNLFGAVNMVRAFVPKLAGADAAIVNFLSLSALAGGAYVGGYSASKAAALGMTQSIRAELSAKNISVHAVFPGPVDTDMAAAASEIDKASPLDVANRVLDGVEKGTEDIFPDPMSANMEPLWVNGGKRIEAIFAEFITQAQNR